MITKKEIHGVRFFSTDEEALLMLEALRDLMHDCAKKAEQDDNPKTRYATLKKLAKLVLMYDTIEDDATIPF